MSRRSALRHPRVPQRRCHGRSGARQNRIAITAVLVAVVSAVAAIGILRAAPAIATTWTGGRLAPTAVLVDEMAADDPRTDFRASVAASLAASGYRLEVVPPDEATVRTYRDLPAFGADLVVLRAHTALVFDGTRLTDEVALFTSEAVDPTVFGIAGLAVAANARPSLAAIDPERRTDLSLREIAALVPVRRRTGADRRPFLGVGPDFVRDHLRGRFRDRTVVILMGCDSMRGRRMSEAFLARGAGAVLGWSDQVSAAHTDKATASLVASLAGGIPVDESLAAAMSAVGPDPATGAYLIAAVQ